MNWSAYCVKQSVRLRAIDVKSKRTMTILICSLIYDFYDAKIEKMDFRMRGNDIRGAGTT